MYNSFSPMELHAANNVIAQMLELTHAKLKEDPKNNHHQLTYKHWMNRRKQLPTPYDIV